jgi:CBS domain-containing protein
MEDWRPVSEVMTRGVIAIHPNAKLADAARLMRENHVSGLPVIGDDDRLVGIISEMDLVRDLHKAAGIGSARGILDLLLDSSTPGGASIQEVCEARLDRARVKELMTRKVATVTPEEGAAEAARLMRLWKVNRLPVVDVKGRVVGILTRADLVHAISGEDRPRTRGRRKPGPVTTAKRPPNSDPYADI